jgi:hypothetical protein
MKLLVMKFSPLPCYLVLLGPNILLDTLFSNIFSLRSSLNISDQVSHTYKTTGKIMVLYISTPYREKGIFVTKYSQTKPRYIYTV